MFAVAIATALLSVIFSGNLIGGNSGILLSGFFGISSGNGNCNKRSRNIVITTESRIFTGHLRALNGHFFK